MSIKFNAGQSLSQKLKKPSKSGQELIFDFQ